MLLDSSQYNICFIRAGVGVSAREFRFHKKKVFYICCAKFLLYYVLANNFKKVFLIPESNLFHHSSFQQFFFSLIIIVHFIRRNLFNKKCFSFHLKSSFCSWDIQFFVFSSSPLFFPVSHCIRGWFKRNPKVYVIICLNKNLVTHFVWYLGKEIRCDI